MEEEKTFTQADIDNLEAKHKEELTELAERLKSEHKRKLDGALKELRADLEKKANEANMSELEKAQSRIKDLEAKYQEKEDLINLNNQKDETRAYLKEIGVDVANLDYVFIPKDMDGTKARANAFKEMIDNVKKDTWGSNMKSTIPNANKDNGNADAALKKAFGL